MSYSAGKTVSSLDTRIDFFLRTVAGVGRFTLAQWNQLRHAAAVIGAVLCVCVQPRYWVRPVRKAFARQLLAMGVAPLGFVALSQVTFSGRLTEGSAWVVPANMVGR